MLSKEPHQTAMGLLRGCLDVPRQFSTLAVSPEKLACRFDAFSSDIALKQVIRTAVSKLSRLSSAPDNQRALHELRFVYTGVSDVASKAIRWDCIVLDRTSHRWGVFCLLHIFFYLTGTSRRTRETSRGTRYYSR